MTDEPAEGQNVVRFRPKPRAGVRADDPTAPKHAGTLVDIKTRRSMTSPEVCVTVDGRNIPVVFMGNPRKRVVYDPDDPNSVKTDFNALARKLAEICNEIYEDRGIEGIRTLAKTPSLLNTRLRRDERSATGNGTPPDVLSEDSVRRFSDGNGRA